jgi:hypothetical protein
MSDSSSTNNFGNVPPWVWVLLLLGGGGGVGTLTGLELGGSSESEDCSEHVLKAEEAFSAHESMSNTLISILDLLTECRAEQ